LYSRFCPALCNKTDSGTFNMVSVSQSLVTECWAKARVQTTNTTAVKNIDFIEGVLNKVRNKLKLTSSLFENVLALQQGDARVREKPIELRRFICESSS